MRYLIMREIARGRRAIITRLAGELALRPVFRQTRFKARPMRRRRADQAGGVGMIHGVERRKLGHAR